MDKIFISGLQISALIGVNDVERLKQQPIILDIEIFISTEKAAKTDQLSDTLDYDAVVANLQTWAALSQFHLLEALANYLAQKILTQFAGAQGVRLSITKPGIPFAERVGLVVERGVVPS